MSAWEWALAATGAGAGPIVIGFLTWAWIYSTKEPPTTKDEE